MPLASEREVERIRRTALLVRLRRGDDRDVHTPGGVDPVVVDLGEHELFGHAERVVAVAVERLRREAAEVTDSRDRQRDEAIEEFVHPVTSEGDLAADGLTLTQLEAGKALLGPGDHRLLAGNGLHVGQGALKELGLADGVTDAHVDLDLLDLGHHDVVEFQSVLELGPDLVVPGPGRRVIVVVTCLLTGALADTDLRPVVETLSTGWPCRPSG